MAFVSHKKKTCARCQSTYSMRRVVEHLESFHGIRLEGTVEDEETGETELALHVISVDLVNLSEKNK